MKKLVTFTALAIMIAALAYPVFAQDEVVLTGGDIDSLFGGGNNNRGRGNNNQPQIPDPVYLFEDVKALLKNNKVALDKNQEKSLQAFLTTETAAIRTALEAQFTNRGNNNGRGGNNNQLTMITDLEAAVSKHNATLLTEIKAALTPDQVSLLSKAEKDKKVCTVMLDLVNFQQLAARFQNEQNNFRGRGGGGPGGFEGGGLDIIGLDLGGGGGGGNNGFPGNRGGNQIASILPSRAACTSKDSTPAQRVAVLGDILTKGKKPLTADQSAKFEPMADTHMKTMVEELKAKDQQIDRLVNDLNNQIKNNQNQNNNQNQAQQPPTVNVQTLTNNIVNTIMQNLGIQTNNNNNQNQNNRGGRGNQNNQNQNNNQPANNQAAANNQPANQNQNQNNQNQNQNFQNRGNNNGNFNIQAEVQKKSEELMDKLAASLKPEQAVFVKKMKWDQIKAKGGVDRYRAILESEGTPLTPEQITQIQNLINAEGQAVRAAAQTLVQKEIQALPEGALQAAALQYQQEQQRLQQQQQNPQQNRNNNNQQNNVNQNQEAQKIIAKVLPDVSKRHAQLLGATQEAILKVMTPPQQASYKINTLPVK